MSIFGKCQFKPGTLFFAALLSICLLFVGNESASAIGGGSWGSNGGSLGGGSLGGGSWGSGGGGSGGGLLGGRRPLRNLLGRIGSRFDGGSNGSGGSWGSSGGASTGSWASTGGSGGFGSSGSSTGFGSRGSSTGYGSGGYGSGGSGGYVSSSTGIGYGSWGSSYLSSLNSGPSYVGTVAPAYSSFETGYQAPDYGYSSGIPMDGFINEGIPMDSGIPVEAGADFMAPGYSLDSIPMEGGIIDPGMQPNYYDGGTLDSGNFDGGNFDGGTFDGSFDGGSGVEQPPIPGPAGDDGETSNQQPSDTIAVLNLQVPLDAKVYINDKLTRTEGESRSYISKDLKPNRDYHYNVKAVVVRNGKELVKTERVSIRTGSTETVAMEFETTPTTLLALNVPSDAKVTLCGKTTRATGAVRHFATSKLQPGATWNGYTVEVSVERDGKVLSREKKLDLQAGETYALSFDFDVPVSKQVASK